MGPQSCDCGNPGETTTPPCAETSFNGAAVV